MTTLMFQPQFTDKVAGGCKRRTIRPVRKRPIRIGDKLSLRKWSGKAYRSPQVELRQETCIDTRLVRIQPNLSVANPCSLLFLDGIEQGLEARHWFAKDDGFLDWSEMVEWFRSTHGLPFEGVLIRW
jgi:hypothetical protein